jgi:hypothetical protein
VPLEEFKSINDSSILLSALATSEMNKKNKKRLIVNFHEQNKINTKIVANGLSQLHQFQMDKLYYYDYKNADYYITTYLDSNSYVPENMSSQYRGQYLDSIEKGYKSKYDQLDNQRLSFFKKAVEVINFSVVIIPLYTAIDKEVQLKLGQAAQQKSNQIDFVSFNPDDFREYINKNTETSDAIKENINLIHLNNLKTTHNAIKNNQILLEMEASNTRKTPSAKRQRLSNDNTLEDELKPTAVDNIGQFQLVQKNFILPPIDLQLLGSKKINEAIFKQIKKYDQEIMNAKDNVALKAVFTRINGYSNSKKSSVIERSAARNEGNLYILDRLFLKVQSNFEYAKSANLLKDDSIDWKLSIDNINMNSVSIEAGLKLYRLKNQFQLNQLIRSEKIHKIAGKDLDKHTAATHKKMQERLLSELKELNLP